MEATLSLARATESLEELGMRKAAETLATLADEAAKEDITYVDFLLRLLDGEIQERHRRYTETCMKWARFPFKKTLAQFDFSYQPSIDERLVKELATLAFVQKGDNLLILGPPGVGKSHLAVALGIEAVSKRLSVYFVTAHELVNDLKKACAANSFEKRLRLYTKPRLLIIDELGYFNLDALAAASFFRLVSERYQKGSIIITSNLSYGSWGGLFGDTVLAGAVLDRLLHHSSTLNIKGNSYRLKDKLKAGIVSSREVKL